MELRQPVATVGYIDDYCLMYRAMFGDVRLYECVKWLHVGIVSILPRKSLPAIAKLNGLKDGQSLHHFLCDAVWDVEQMRAIRIQFIQAQIGQRGISLCIDETGDVKRGSRTDYVASQYIGNLGKTANGMVSVNAYAVVDKITYPLLFRIYKPRPRLQAGDVYQLGLSMGLNKSRMNWVGMIIASPTTRALNVGGNLFSVLTYWSVPMPSNSNNIS